MSGSDALAADAGGARGRGARRDLARSHRVGPGVHRRRVTVYVSDDERAMLQVRADSYGVSMSRVLVDGALHAGESAHIDGATLSAYLSILVDLQGQLQRIGGNLNQLAHHANATMDFPVEAADVAKEARRIVVRLEDVLESVRR